MCAAEKWPQKQVVPHQAAKYYVNPASALTDESNLHQIRGPVVWLLESGRGRGWSGSLSSVLKSKLKAAKGH